MNLKPCPNPSEPTITVAEHERLMAERDAVNAIIRSQQSDAAERRRELLTVATAFATAHCSGCGCCSLNTAVDLAQDLITAVNAAHEADGAKRKEGTP